MYICAHELRSTAGVDEMTLFVSRTERGLEWKTSLAKYLSACPCCLVARDSRSSNSPATEQEMVHEMRNASPRLEKMKGTERAKVGGLSREFKRKGEDGSRPGGGADA